MPNIKSAIKKAKQGEARRKINLARRTNVKTAIKKVLAAVTSEDDIEVVKELLRDAESKIARAKGKGVLHYKTAARNISRLAKKVAAKEKPAQASK